jgi:hypothetical protein
MYSVFFVSSCTIIYIGTFGIACQLTANALSLNLITTYEYFESEEPCTIDQPTNPAG